MIRDFAIRASLFLRKYSPSAILAAGLSAGTAVSPFGCPHHGGVFRRLFTAARRTGILRPGKSAQELSCYRDSRRREEPGEEPGGLPGEEAKQWR
jgi:hypothetical protein